MEAWQSWGIFAAVVAGSGYYYYTSSGQKKRGRGWKPFTPKQALRRDSSKSRRDSRDRRRKEQGVSGHDRPNDDQDVNAGSSAQASGNESAQKRKGKKPAQPSKLAESSAVDAPGRLDQDEPDNAEDLEFAKQLQDKMTGTSLKKPEGVQNKKARKQAKRAEAELGAQDIPPSQALPQQNSTASSTTGADADDDMSSSTSLDLGPTTSGADVSDMLEPALKGPSVLRITEATNAQSQNKPKPQKPHQEPETKKQRQNRKKKEEEKALREQVEKDRQAALENQRRTAREARGEPAKNGLGTSQQPAKNAWTGVTKAGGNNDTLAMPPPPPPSAGGELLDTFAKEEPKQVNGNSDYSSLPSEEEQLKLIHEMDNNGWSTVSAKGGKKPKQKPSTSQLDEGHTQAKADGQAPTPADSSSFPKGAMGTALNAQANGVDVAPLPDIRADAVGKAGNTSAGRKKATKETIDHSKWNRSNIHEHPDYDPNFPYALTGHPDDSDWAVV